MRFALNNLFFTTSQIIDNWLAYVENILEFLLIETSSSKQSDRICGFDTTEQFHNIWYGIGRYLYFMYVT